MIPSYNINFFKVNFKKIDDTLNTIKARKQS